MSTQYIVIIIAVIFFIIPFIVWTITRFRTRVLQRYSQWHKIALINYHNSTSKKPNKHKGLKKHTPIK